MKEPNNQSFPYEDMLTMMHPTSRKHPRMSTHDRAAQFSPFAALTGYEDALKETAVIVTDMPELTDDARENMNHTLRLLAANIDRFPSVTIRYFKPDSKPAHLRHRVPDTEGAGSCEKAGGTIEYATGSLCRIDSSRQLLMLLGGLTIPFSHIVSIICQNTENDPQEKQQNQMPG